jgi:hypothetical protein
MGQHETPIFLKAHACILQCPLYGPDHVLCYGILCRNISKLSIFEIRATKHSYGKQLNPNSHSLLPHLPPAAPGSPRTMYNLDAHNKYEKEENHATK